MKYKYFAIGNEIFFNGDDFCLRINTNIKFPVLEFLEDYNIEYYIKNWSKQMVPIDEIIFKRKFKEIAELIKSKIE